MPTALPIFLDNAKTCLNQGVPLTTTVTDSWCVYQRGHIVLPKSDSFVLMKSIHIRDLVIGIILHAFKMFLLVAVLDNFFMYTTDRASNLLSLIWVQTIRKG